MIVRGEKVDSTFSSRSKSRPATAILQSSNSKNLENSINFDLWKQQVNQQRHEETENEKKNKKKQQQQNQQQPQQLQQQHHQQPLKPAPNIVINQISNSNISSSWNQNPLSGSVNNNNYYNNNYLSNSSSYNLNTINANVSCNNSGLYPNSSYYYQGKSIAQKENNPAIKTPTKSRITGKNLVRTSEKFKGDISNTERKPIGNKAGKPLGLAERVKTPSPPKEKPLKFVEATIKQQVKGPSKNNLQTVQIELKNIVGTPAKVLCLEKKRVARLNKSLEKSLSKEKISLILNREPLTSREHPNNQINSERDEISVRKTTKSIEKPIFSAGGGSPILNSKSRVLSPGPDHSLGKKWGMSRIISSKSHDYREDLGVVNSLVLDGQNLKSFNIYSNKKGLEYCQFKNNFD
jgi:hypothetical protein